MSNAKHTPGPWRVGDNGATVFGPKTESPSPRTIATLTKVPMILNETKANARLIAAAPDGLSCAEIVLNNLKAMKPMIKLETEFDRLTYQACIDACEAFITKATGGAE